MNNLQMDLPLDAPAATAEEEEEEEEVAASPRSQFLSAIAEILRRGVEMKQLSDGYWVSQIGPVVRKFFPREDDFDGNADATILPAVEAVIKSMCSAEEKGLLSMSGFDEIDNHVGILALTAKLKKKARI
jgi:hypothetical protein